MNLAKFPKTLFIVINPRPGWTKEKTMIDFPIGLCCVVSEVKRAGFEFDILDLLVNQKSDDEVVEIAKRGHYDVIALGGLSHAYHVIKPLVAKIKKKLSECVIVVGGGGVTGMPGNFLKWTKADVGVIGEGQDTMVEILGRIQEGKSLKGVMGIVYRENGKILEENPRPPLLSLEKVKRPLWELFSVDTYVESVKNYNNKTFVDFFSYRPFPINSSLGCPYRCTFCSHSFDYKFIPYRSFTPHNVINKMKALNEMFKINYFWFWDDLTFVSKRHAEPLVDALLDCDFGFKMEMTVRVGFIKENDRSFARKLKKIGLTTLNYALESGSPKILKAMNKKIKLRDFYQQKKVLDEVGIRTNTCIVLGYPQETRETIDETFRILYETKSYPSVGFLVPAPGSVIYDFAIKNGFIKDEEEYLLTIGERQRLGINMTKLSDKELYGYVIEKLKKLRDICGKNIDDEHLIANTVLLEDV